MHAGCIRIRFHVHTSSTRSHYASPLWARSQKHHSFQIHGRSYSVEALRHERASKHLHGLPGNSSNVGSGLACPLTSDGPMFGPPDGIWPQACSTAEPPDRHIPQTHPCCTRVRATTQHDPTCVVPIPHFHAMLLSVQHRPPSHASSPRQDRTSCFFLQKHQTTKPALSSVWATRKEGRRFFKTAERLAHHCIRGLRGCVSVQLILSRGGEQWK